MGITGKGKWRMMESGGRPESGREKLRTQGRERRRWGEGDRKRRWRAVERRGRGC